MTDHPAGEHMGVGKQRLWFGLEVEGRLRSNNLWTAFINAPLEEPELRRLEKSLKKGETKHLFICEDFGGDLHWMWFETVLLKLSTGLPITIARRPSTLEIAFVKKQEWAYRVSLMVRASETADWMTLLQPGDQISVGIPYDLTTWRVSDGVVTKPADYEGDSE
jgi:hypothetical protein